MNNYRCFVIKYLGCTEDKGYRARLTDTRFKKSVIIGRKSTDLTYQEQILKWLEDKGIKMIGHAWNEISGEDYYFTDDFETQIK